MTIKGALACLVLVLAAAGAAAKDLPRVFKDRRATGCEAFGPDFIKVAGSDTCVRVSGFVRAEVSVSSGGGTSADRH